MKKEIENKNDAKEKLKKHLGNMAIKNRPYVTKMANKNPQPMQKPRS